MPRDKKEPPRKRRPAYYWWLLANIVAACGAVASWVVCTNIFMHPEVPRNYEIMRKLGQAGLPQPLTEMQAPPGEAGDPRALYHRYANLPKVPLDRLNLALMRNYLTKLRSKGLIQYVEGNYQVEAIRRLTDKDLFPQGFVVRARAMLPPDEFSQPAPWPVIIEYLFPTPDKLGMIQLRRAAALEELKKTNPKATDKDIPDPVVTDDEVENYTREAFSSIAPGDQLKVTKFPNCAMVLHVARLEGEDTPVVCLTVTPAAFGEYSVGSDKSFRLTAPTELHPGAPLPAFLSEANAHPAPNH